MRSILKYFHCLVFIPDTNSVVFDNKASQLVKMDYNVYWGKAKAFYENVARSA
jgi:uncharacterized protein YcfL